MDYNQNKPINCFLKREIFISLEVCTIGTERFGNCVHESCSGPRSGHTLLWLLTLMLLVAKLAKTK